ncbi:MAG TPA: RHS repeat-associated core domain-containing protein [Longimicrobium sp.]|nr:RHS repeat-associated core domain-containing protein [Longimicrobium sp.]
MYKSFSTRLRARLGALAILTGALAFPQRAAAQQCTEEPCGTVDFTAPTVTVSPQSDIRSPGLVAVTINWSDNNYLDWRSRQILFDGQDVTGNFTYGGPNNWTATSTGTVNVSGVGAHTITASINDAASNNGSGSATYTIPSPGVRVSVENGPGSVASGANGTARFRVVNTGSIPTTYTMITPCPAGFGGCTASVPTVVLPPNDSAWVDVTFTAPAAGNGWIQLTAASGSVSTFAGATVTVVAAPDPGFPGDARSLERIQRDACVAVGLGSGAASECGDLVVAHPLPGVRVMNAGVQPTLVYNSNHARPHPVVAEHLAGPAGTVPDTIRAVLLVNGVQVATMRWPGWGAAQTRRIALSFDASNTTLYPTGVYTYALQVTGEWLTGTQQSLKVRTGRMVIVNRSASPFGAGWWLSGVEQLVHVPGDTVKVWVGGDGSARLYRGNPGGPWRTEAYDRPDSLYNGVSAEHGTVTVRTLPGRAAESWFDVQGRHLRTINFMQQYTAYRWNGSYLTQVNLPYNAARGDTARYLFEYNNNPTAAQRHLSRVAAPGLAVTRDTWLQADATGRVTRITDPDSSYVGFLYYTSTKWMTQRTDRRGAAHGFGYIRVRFHTSTRVVSPGVNATTRVQAVATLGMNGASVSMDSVRSVYDGARPGTEVCDCIWWHVNRWGAPTDMKDPWHRVTTIQRGDPRWPALATGMTASNGFTTTASYDERGNLASMTEWNPYGDGQNATTTFQSDSVWDATTRIVAPEGEVTTRAYDGYRRRTWEQVGPDASRRVTYGYFPLSDTRAPGGVETVNGPSGTYRLEYDVRGNLQASISPRYAIRTEILSDVLGRVIRTRIPADSLPGMTVGWKSDTTTYDRAGRATYTVATGPAMNGAPEQKLHVVREYDLEGNLTAAERWSTPDLATTPVGHVRTRWRYDLGGRAVAEIAPDGAVDSTFYDLAGNPKEVHTRRTDPVTGSPLVVRLFFDAANRMVERQVPQVSYAPRDAGIPLHYRATGGAICTGPLLDRTYPQRPNDGGCGYRIDAQTETFAYHELGGLARADNADAQVRRGYYRGGALATDTLRIRTVAGADFSSHQYVLGYRYDRNGRRIELQHPAQLAPSPTQRTVQYGYDPITGGLASVTDPMGNQFKYEYNTSGDLTRRIFVGGMTDQFEYGGDGTLSTQITHAYNPVEAVRHVTLTRDAAGRVLQARNYFGGNDSLSVRYSGLGHAVFTSSSTLDGTSVPAWKGTERFSYDALGNMASMNEEEARKLSDGTLRESYTRRSTAFAPVTGRPGAGTANHWNGLTTRDGIRITTGHTDPVEYDASGNEVFTSQLYTSTGSCNSQLKAEADCSDRASYYEADGWLRAADHRYRMGDDNGGFWRTTFEEYRYDALGRRVWVRSRQECPTTMGPATQGYPLGPCYSSVRRTVWDGGSELWEIQMPGADTSSYLENDVNPLPLRQYVTWSSDPSQLPPPGYQPSMTSWFDPNPVHGRVAYTHGLGIDQPLSLLRIGLNVYYPAPFPDIVGQGVTFAPHTRIPLWDWRGRVTGTVYPGGAKQHCQTFSGTSRCTSGTASAKWTSYSVGTLTAHWNGTVLGGKRDATGTLYRRARTYDPGTGRFTQEDPIGLAGGVNLYGYAGGDPVNSIDPSGNIPVPLITGLIGAGIGAAYGGYKHGWRGAFVGAVAGGLAGAGLGYAGVGLGVLPASVGGVTAGGTLGPLTVVDATGKAASVSASAASAATASASGAAQLAVQFGKDPNQVYHTFRHVIQMGLDPTAVRAAVEQHLPTVIGQLQPGKPLNQIITIAGQRIQYTAFRLADGVINIGRIHGVP